MQTLAAGDVEFLRQTRPGKVPENQKEYFDSVLIEGIRYNESSCWSLNKIRQKYQSKSVKNMSTPIENGEPKKTKKNETMFKLIIKLNRMQQSQQSRIPTYSVVFPHINTDF